MVAAAGAGSSGSLGSGANVADDDAIECVESGGCKENDGVSCICSLDGVAFSNG